MKAPANTVLEQHLVRALWFALVSGLVSLALATLAAA